MCVSVRVSHANHRPQHQPNRRSDIDCHEHSHYPQHPPNAARNLGLALTLRQLFGHRDHPLEPAGTDPVHALFVLLHLLERHPDPIRKFGLRQAALKPSQTHARSDFSASRLSARRSQERQQAPGVIISGVHQRCATDFAPKPKE